MIAAFSIARVPRIEFGAGSIGRLPAIAAGYGKHLLLVTGQRSFVESAAGEWLLGELNTRGFSWQHLKVDGEPTPQLVDAAVASLRRKTVDAVVGIGGGSALDAAKAIAGLLKPGNSVIDHLEGVGPELPYCGPATPFIAVPTTAGTGSEATRNAVLSLPGQYKKSFRDDALVAQWAIVDPDLLATCPPELIAADGMDAFTQLLESFVSTRANPLTDALARSGLAAASEALLPLYGNPTPAARAGMAYASLVSGICLAQTGLGAVHGLAAPLGAFFPIPHGVACGTLLAAATQVNIAALRERDPQSIALAKYEEVRRLLAADDLAAMLAGWIDHLRLPRLSHWRVATTDFPRIVANARGSSMKTNPIELTDAEIRRILEERL
ncbi:MAG: iron-containing alcohol dehydrogenase [Rhodocyclales bacterium]|nr:iron-containing alcohol dehydrogenase [Rhodocyclales bacterium]